MDREEIIRVAERCLNSGHSHKDEIESANSIIDSAEHPQMEDRRTFDADVARVMEWNERDIRRSQPTYELYSTITFAGLN